MTARTQPNWRGVIRRWLSLQESGSVFRSRELYRWVEANVELSDEDRRPQSNGNPVWRHRLSQALRSMHLRGELSYAAKVSTVWRVP